MIDITRFDAVSLDVYGTVLDWEPEITSILQQWVSAAGRAIDREVLLSAYDRIRQPLQDERPALQYPDVLKRTLERMGDEFGMAVPTDLLERFSGIAATHKPFADSVGALHDMRSMGLKLAALSNIDDRSFATAMTSAGIEFDVVVTAQRVGAYKPDPAHFWAALSDLRAMGVPMQRTLHVAQSRRADIVVANAIGLTSVWVNRPGHAFGRTDRGAEDAKPDYTANSLSHVVDMLRG